MFELFFKYPVSLFEKGHFVFLTPWPLWLLAAGIAAAAGLLFWHVRRNHGMLTGARPVAIWLLETAMVALILFLLWHPALSVATLKPQQNVVAILVDNSRSMGIADVSGTREAAARTLLEGGLLKALSDRFQVRLYKFGKEPIRIQNPAQLQATEPASRLGDTLERVLAESSSLPLGAVVMLSDGSDNSGGVDLQTISAIRRQRIPIHTIGFGRERPDRDVEIVDAIVPARALPQSKLTAQVSLQSYGISGAKTRLSVRDGSKTLVTREIALQGDGVLQTESMVFDCGPAGPKTLEIAVDPVAGEENTLNNKVTRLVNVENRKPRILYMEGEPRWEYKFIRRALDDYPNIEIASILRTTQNKLYRQGTKDDKELADGFPAKAEELFAYQGLIIGSVEASYFTPAQQALIRDFVDRRGGGLLFLGGRASLSDGGIPDFAPGRTGSHQAAGRQGHVSSRFHRPAAHRRGRAEHYLPAGRRPRAQRRALEEDAANGELPGSGRGQAGGHRAAGIHPRRTSPAAPAGNRKLRARPHHGVRHRGKLALEDVDRSRRQNPARFLAADLSLSGDRCAGAGDRDHSQGGAGRRNPRARARRGKGQGIQAGE